MSELISIYLSALRHKEQLGLMPQLTTQPLWSGYKSRSCIRYILRKSIRVNS